MNYIYIAVWLFDSMREREEGVSKRETMESLVLILQRWFSWRSVVSMERSDSSWNVVNLPCKVADTRRRTRRQGFRHGWVFCVRFLGATRRNRARRPALKCQSRDEKEAERKREDVRRLRSSCRGHVSDVREEWNQTHPPCTRAQTPVTVRRTP